MGQSGQRPWWTRKSSPKWSKAQWHMAWPPRHELWSPSPGMIGMKAANDFIKVIDGASSLVWILDSSKSEMWWAFCEPKGSTQHVLVLCHPTSGTWLPCRWTSSQRSFSSSRLAAKMVQGMTTLHYAWMRLGNDKQHSCVFSDEPCDWDLRGKVQGGNKKTKLQQTWAKLY